MRKVSATSTEQKPKVLLAMVCDGVRKEITGQETIVGVYPDTLEVRNLPLNFSPVVYLRVKFGRTGQHKVEFRITQVGGIALVNSITVPIDLQGDAIATLVFGPVPLIIQSYGNVMFEIKCDDGSWLVALTMEFRRMPSSGATPRVVTAHSDPTT